MRKTIKQILTVLLAVALFGTLLAGCGDDRKSGEANKSDLTDIAQADPTEAPAVTAIPTTQAPTEPTTEAPTEPATQAPTESGTPDKTPPAGAIELDQEVDMYDLKFKVPGDWHYLEDDVAARWFRLTEDDIADAVLQVIPQDFSQLLGSTDEIAEFLDEQHESIEAGIFQGMKMDPADPSIKSEGGTILGRPARFVQSDIPDATGEIRFQTLTLFAHGKNLFTINIVLSKEEQDRMFDMVENFVAEIEKYEENYEPVTWELQPTTQE